MQCHICGKPGADIPDPCCSAPDCENKLDYAHLECLSPSRQREELAFQDLFFADLR
jgi:hypothetical protein